jgi:tRNA U34 5-methylaminomethyl-2-thiouridine-forming methyltransferase MnmC
VLKAILTADGSSSLLNTSLNETYHSIHGAVQESLHVFIHHGLNYALAQKSEIKILEVGFGTGLNAFLTLQQLDGTSYKVEYTTIEAFPIEEAIWQKLNYANSETSKEWFNEIHRAPWGEWATTTSSFKLLKLHTTLQQVSLESQHYNVVYFDAFAPNKQPEMWTLPMLKKIADAMTVDGAFVTYCAKGQLKRDLQSLSLKVEALPGPPGKREMVRAIKF